MSLPDYYDRVNPDLLAVLPAGLADVVEVGCGAGAMGAQYKRSNPGCRYVGIESHAEAAAQARERLDRVIVADAEHIADGGPPVGSADALVYGDVLEHFVDPWAALKRHVRWLRPGGLVAACIPNLQHWTIFARLLTGQWRYEDEGLLDRTHLRFFTYETVAHLFESAGLRIVATQCRTFGRQEGWENFQRLVRPLLDAAGVDAQQFALRSQTLQYVVRGERVEQ